MSRAGNNESISGFTLAELLVVLAIMAGIIAVAPAAFRTAIPAAQLRQDTIDTLVFLRDARRQAVSAGTAVSVGIGEDGLTVNVGDSETPLALNNIELSYEPAFENTSLDDTEVPMRFLPDGSSSGGQLTLRRDDTTQTIAINWLTGYVKVLP